MPQEYTITVAETGERFCCKPDEFVLAAMHRARCGPISHGCCGGGCGVCKMRVAAGEYQVAKKMSRAHISVQEEAENIVLLCCIQPRGDLVVARHKQTK